MKKPYLKNKIYLVRLVRLVRNSLLQNINKLECHIGDSMPTQPLIKIPIF